MVTRFLVVLGVLAGSAMAQTPDQAAELAAIKEYALNYTANLPNYTAKQRITRRTKPTAQGRFTMGGGTFLQIVEEQVTYADKREIHKVLSVNGIAVKETDQNDESGMYSRGEFALLLGTMFRSEAKTAFKWSKSARLDGRRVSVYNISVPQLPYGYGLVEGERTLLVPFKGSIFADAETHAVVRIQIECTDIPHVSEYEKVELTLDYKPTKVAGQEYILPARFRTDIRRKDSDVVMEAEYRDYQKFSADATIIFDEEPSGAH